MDDDNWRRHISVDPLVCHGRPCIAGTRILVSAVLANLADGMAEEELVRHYPSLKHDDIRAALHYAAAVAQERIVDIAPATR